MKSNSFLFWSMLAFMSAAVIHAFGEEVQPYAIPGRYIVVLKPGHRSVDVMGRHDIKARHVFSHALQGFAGEISADRLEALRQDPRVELIEPELELFSAAQTLSTGVKRIGANVSPMAKIDGLDERVNADIAILDTGIAPHPDLNIYTNVSFITGQTTDGNGHGTHVAGIAAAIDNGAGVVGVAPGARLWAIKVMDDTGAGTTATVIKGVDFVTQNAGQIEVANLCFVGIGYSSALRQAISNSVAKGIVFVVAAGNDSRDIYGPDGVQNTADDSIPAAYPEVMTVSALYDLDGVPSADDVLASFSNYSRNVVAGNPVTSPGAAIDLAAPGVNIASTYLNSGYATMSGTSMAAPHAAGAAALYIAAHARATNATGVAAIRQALINLAQPQTAWGSANTQDPDANHEGLVYVANISPPIGNPPAVAITAPASGSTFLSGATVTFVGVATDPDTGDCTSGLIWTSSRDGQIGTGGSCYKALSVGTHTLTASVTDATGKTGSASITVTVSSSTTSATASFYSPTAITIPDSGPATPYPSAINVSGLSGTISKVTVTLRNFTHDYARDVDMILVSPTGQKVILMSDVGGSYGLNNVTLTLSDGVAAALPATSEILSGTYLPTDLEPGDVFPAPAPAGPYATAMSAFNGQSPNGTWSLYVVDDGPSDQGVISGGWSLSVTTVQVQAANNSPVVSITSPASGASFASGSTITFSGTATDTEDGNRTANLSWTSSLSGPIGTGGTVSKVLTAGTHTITASVTDSGGLTASKSISVTVNPSSTGGTASFSSPTAITIPDSGAATPYPSPINVSGMSGTISKVTVTLRNLSHDYARDVDMILVSPTGQKVILMSDVGGSYGLNNVTLTLSDGVAAALPATSEILSGTYLPTDLEPGDVFPAPAPAGPYATAMSAFNGQSPNGTWSLYVVDDGPSDQGVISGGWSLTVTTGSAAAAPTISDIADQSTPANTATAAIPFTVNDADTAATSLVLTATSSNPTLVPVANIVFGGSGSSRTVMVTPASGQVGTASITVKVSDGVLTASDTFVVTVVDSTPILRVAVVTDKSTYSNGNRVYVTATVTDGANRISGATAQLTLVTANGRQVNFSANTDSNGIAKFQYRVYTSRDGTGTFTGTVTASKSGYTSGSGSTTFTLR